MFVQGGEGDEPGAALHNVVAGAVEALPGAALAQVAHQHHDGPPGRCDELLAVAHGLCDVCTAAQMNAHQRLHRVIHPAGEIYHSGVEDHQMGGEHGESCEDPRHDRRVDDTGQHGAALVHRDDHRPGVIPLHPAAEIELFQDQTLILPVIVGQIFPYGPPDIQIPKGADWAAAGAVQLPQGRAPDLMLHFFGQLLYHPRHDPPGGIQYRPLHHTLQTEDHFQQRLIRLQLFQHLLIREQGGEVIAVQRMALENFGCLLGEQVAHFTEPAGHRRLALSLTALRIPAHVRTGLTDIEKVQRVIHSFQLAASQGKGSLRAFSQYQPPSVERCSMGAHASIPPITMYLRSKARQPAVSFSASLPKLLE